MAVDTLIVSDLHLHRGSDPAVAEDFAGLLAKRAACTLVLNGDVFDLDQVAGERRAGIETTAYRLLETIEAHPALGAALQDWIARGGRVVWLAGNHDAEICLPAHRDLLCRLLDLDPGRVRFENEHHREAGLHVEHGHQHDPDNRFFPDTPTAVSRRRLSALPLGCLTTRYLLCRIPAFVNRGDNHLTPLRVLGRVIRNHGLRTPRMVALYVLAAFRIALQAVFARRRGDADRDHQTPMASPWRVLGRMYIDRVALAAALGLVVALFTLGRLAPGGGGGLGAGAALAAGLPCALLLFWAPSRRRRYRHRDRQGCRDAARAAIGQGAKMVVMGHVHHAEELAIDGGCYINPGAFSLPEDQGRPYVVVRGDEACIEYHAS